MKLTASRFVAALLMTISASSMAGSAQCGDLRKIMRESSDSFLAANCQDRAHVESIQALASAVAEGLVRERLAKFDGECEAIGGDVAELAVDRLPFAHVVRRPRALSRCLAGVQVQITHACECGDET